MPVEPVEPTPTEPIESALAELQIDSATPAPEFVVHETYGDDLFGDLPPSMIRLALKRLANRGEEFSPALPPKDEEHRSVVLAVVGASKVSYLKKKEKARLASARRRQAAKLAKESATVDQKTVADDAEADKGAENEGADAP